MCPPCWSNTRHLTNHSPPSRINVSCIFIAFFQISNQSGWQVSGVSHASQFSMNHSCCLAHSCLGASGSGRYEVGQMERPHGSSRCFAFVYAQLIKNNKRCHPGVCAICGGADNCFSSSLVNNWRTLIESFKLFSDNP